MEVYYTGKKSGDAIWGFFQMEVKYEPTRISFLCELYLSAAALTH